MSELIIGYIKNDDRPVVYCAFLPRDEKCAAKLQYIMDNNIPACREHDLDPLTEFSVMHFDVVEAAKELRQNLEKMGYDMPVDPLSFWISKCPWLQN